MENAIYGFVFSAATISLIVGFIAWLWRRLARHRSFHVIEKGRVHVRLPDPLVRPVLGRAKELAQLEGALAEGSPIVILGTAGVGKTTLGRALADQVSKGERRLIWIDCMPGTNLEAILDLLSLHLQRRYGEAKLREVFEKSQAHDARQWIDLLVDCLHGHRYVFFWDDLYLVQDETVTTRLLPRLFACADVIIMTRENTPDLQTALQSMAQPFFLPLTGLQDSDAVVLLRDRGLLDEPQDLLQQLARKVAGHPKALEVCAGLIKDETHGLSLEQLLSQSLLARDPSQTLLKMLKISDRRLSRHERTMMIACAVFYEPFTREELFAIYHHDQATALFPHLVSRSLVDEGQDHLYSLHPLIREYYQMCGRRMVLTVWGAVGVPEMINPLLGLYLWGRSSNDHFHRRIAQYYQRHRQDTAERESLIVRHLKDARRFRQAAEAEGIILEIRKYPVVIAGHLWSLVVAIGFIWIAAYLGFLLLARTRWPWVVWLDTHKLPFAILTICLGTVWWLLVERKLMRRSWLLVTRRGSLLISNHTWFFPRLLKPRRLAFGPLGWLWRFDRPFIDNSTLTAERTWHILNGVRLGYITAHLRPPGYGQRILRFGPVAEPQQRLAEIYQALGVEWSPPAPFE